MKALTRDVGPTWQVTFANASNNRIDSGDPADTDGMVGQTDLGAAQLVASIPMPPITVTAWIQPIA